MVVSSSVVQPPPPAPPPVSRRRQAHTSRACNYCRKRKTRCDGKHPTCSTCQTHGHTCNYSTEDDARRSASKAYVESLRNRIQALEATLEAVTGTAGKAESPSNINSPTNAEDNGESKDDGNAVLMFKETGGDLHMYGPTSAYSHLQTEPPEIVTSVPGSGYQTPQELERDPEYHACNWNFHLPQHIHLEREQHDLLLSRFFMFYSSWCLRADPARFRRGMVKTLSSPTLAHADPSQGPPGAQKPMGNIRGITRYSPMLHNAILALATPYADDNLLSSQVVRDAFGRKAKSMIDEECSRPTLATVEALALIGSYHSSKMEDGLFSLHLGMAVRISEALGLNVDCSAWARAGHISQQDVVDRVNVFWSIFIQDKLYALFVGRSASIPMSTVTTPLPSVDTRMDEELFHWDGPGTGIKAQPSYLSSTFVETCKASLILTRILEVNYSVKAVSNPINRSVLVSDIRVQLDSWYDNLPSVLRAVPQSAHNAMPHVLMLHLSYWWYSILLHRPYYQHPDTQQLAGKRCDQAADKIVHFFEIWRRLYGLRFTPVTAIQVGFAAGTTYLLAAVNSSPTTKRSQEAVEGVRKCIQLLREMTPTYTAAHQNAEILQNLLKEWTGSQTSPIGRSRKRPTGDTERKTPDAHSGPISHQNLTYSPVSSSGSPPAAQVSPGPVADTPRQHAPHHWSGNEGMPSAGSSSHMEYHHNNMPMQHQAIWDVPFQRVLNGMDVAQQFSFRTFGIESANNPFPPLPLHGYGTPPHMEMMHAGYPPPPPARPQHVPHQHLSQGVHGMRGPDQYPQPEWQQQQPSPQHHPPPPPQQQHQQQQQPMHNGHNGQLHYQYLPPSNGDPRMSQGNTWPSSPY